MNYKHLSIEERSCIRKYYVEGLSYRKVAQLIGRNVSTISWEIRRNCTHISSKTRISGLLKQRTSIYRRYAIEISIT